MTASAPRHPLRWLAGSVRRWIESSAVRAARRARREDREVRLEEAGVRKEGLDDATQLVDEIAAASPDQAAHLDLEALLDRFVELEIGIRRCEELLAEADRPRPSPGSSQFRARIGASAAAVRDTCEARLAGLRDQRADLVELLCVMVQRSALDTTDLQDDPVAVRLALLRADD